MQINFNILKLTLPWLLRFLCLLREWEGRQEVSESKSQLWKPRQSNYAIVYKFYMYSSLYFVFLELGLSTNCISTFLSFFPLKPQIEGSIGRLKGQRGMKRLPPSPLLPVGFLCFLSLRVLHNNLSSSPQSSKASLAAAAESNLHFSNTCKNSHIEQVSGPDSKHLTLCQPHGFSSNYSALPL